MNGFVLYLIIKYRIIKRHKVDVNVPSPVSNDHDQTQDEKQDEEVV